MFCREFFYWWVETLVQKNTWNIVSKFVPVLYAVIFSRVSSILIGTEMGNIQQYCGFCTCLIVVVVTKVFQLNKWFCKFFISFCLGHELVILWITMSGHFKILNSLCSCSAGSCFFSNIVFCNALFFNLAFNLKCWFVPIIETHREDASKKRNDMSFLVA